MLRTISSIFAALLVLALSACHFGADNKPKPEVDTKFLIHKVKYNSESIKEIAKWYTGSIQNWRFIAVKNPFLDTQKLRAGETVLIPLNLVTNSKPMHGQNAKVAPGKKATKNNNAQKTEEIKEENEEVTKSVETPIAEPVAPVSATSPTPESVINTPEPTVEVVAPVPSAVPEVLQPSAVPTTEPQPTAPPEPGQRSIDDLIAEEQKALELLKNELGHKD